ncbi:hypothetical protein [Nonomuraea sp. NPDC050643]|uniref:hypothetical protein n=1 Tax=Nonomuraea sp. NPDC050643 TaxID=3155660 RepID=UPI0034076CB3
MVAKNPENLPAGPEGNPADEVESLVDELELHSADLSFDEPGADSSTCTCQTCSCTTS